MLGLMRVILTGATGFIGRQVLPLLIEKGYEVHAPFVQTPIQESPHVRWYEADLHDETTRVNVCAEARASHLLHFAWHVNPKDYKTSPENDRWKETTKRLLQAFAESGGTRAVFAGTAMEYDPTLTLEYISEDAPIANH